MRAHFAHVYNFISMEVLERILFFFLFVFYYYGYILNEFLCLLFHIFRVLCACVFVFMCTIHNVLWDGEKLRPWTITANIVCLHLAAHEPRRKSKTDTRTHDLRIAFSFATHSHTDIISSPPFLLALIPTIFMGTVAIAVHSITSSFFYSLATKKPIVLDSFFFLFFLSQKLSVYINCIGWWN